jgi:hypothetical protein
MIFTPAGPSSTASLRSDGIWSAGGVGDFAHELFEDVRRHLPTSRYPEPNGADSTGFSYTSE